MALTHETHTEISPEKEAHTIPYTQIVEVVQLSVARLLDMPGAFTSKSFNEFLLTQPPEKQGRTICEIGLHFDKELIHFVTATMIARRGQPLIIEAEASDGIDGYLPWQDKLTAHLQECEEQGVLQNPRVTVTQAEPVATHSLAA